MKDSVAFFDDFKIRRIFLEIQENDVQQRQQY